VDQQDSDGVEPDTPPADEPEEPKPAKSSKPQEDIQMLKAIEVLNGKSAAAAG
jgi:hypothetical protein